MTEAFPRRRMPPELPPEALTAKEIDAALLRPHRALELVLGRADRLTENLVRGEAMPRLALLVLLTGISFAIPFGAVLSLGDFWKVPVLFTGSVLLCFPCLHVFSSYLGLHLDALHNLILTLLVSSVAGLFTFGFSPILWFVDLTSAAPGATVGAAETSQAFLLVSLFLGIVQLVRCQVRLSRDHRRAGLHGILLAIWIFLLIFMSNRMALLLGLR